MTLNNWRQGSTEWEQNRGENPDQVVADGGYVSRDNIVEMKLRGVEFIGPQCDEEGKGKSSYEGRGVSPSITARSLFMMQEATVIAVRRESCCLMRAKRNATHR